MVLARTYDDTRTYDMVEMMCDDLALDAICIAIPHPFHVKHSQVAVVARSSAKRRIG